jgi:hypothetical protein
MLVQQPWLQIGSRARYRHTRHLLRMPDPTELERGVEASGAELNRQVPWLRVFVEGVVIVGVGASLYVRLHQNGENR